MTSYNSHPNDFDPLALAHIETERIYKDDGETPMNSDEVLKSVLDEFKAVIVQRRGEWYVCRWNEVYSNSNVSFRAYNSNGSRLTNKSVNLAQSIFSYDGTGETTPHHSGENQIIFLEKAYKKLSINYQFGVVSSLVLNPNFDRWPTGNEMPDSWFKAGTINTSRPDSIYGAGLIIQAPLDYANFIYSSNVLVAENDILTFILEGGSTLNEDTNAEVILYLQGTNGVNSARVMEGRA
uniref:Uncharacterized protein n=1 Tax=Bacillus phage Htp1 TaxID=663239 RepID=C7DT93_9VIRU|nr:hypothetical protein [Bacillus phage Htp1]